MRYRSGRQ